jgi:ferredoxin-thioredoxin reductase catalytic subunit
MTGTKGAGEEEILAWARKYAEEHGFQLNPDKKQLATVIRGLLRNKAKHGEQYCLCRIKSGDPEKDRALICPCIYHIDEIEKEGSCHCSLYFRE